MTETTVTPVKAEKQPTRYVVFSAHGTGEGETLSMTSVAAVEAINDLKAIAAAVPEPRDGATYVAIPARSLRVRKVAVVSQPKVVVS